MRARTLATAVTRLPRARPPRAGRTAGGSRPPAVRRPTTAHADSFEHLLQLQRSAGNHAVTSLLDRTDPVVQRYESGEHALMGDKAAGAGSFTISGVELTAGEINAMADLYGSLDDIRHADPDELRRVRDLIRKQRNDPASVSEAEWDTATSGRYTRLNLANSSHFAPSRKPPPKGVIGAESGPDHRKVWQTSYLNALEQAHYAQTVAADGDQAAADKAREEARLYNSFGEHFLVDAFSAGHLFNKDDMLSTLTTKLEALTSKELGTLFTTVATSVWATRSATLKQYQAKAYLVWWDLNSASRFKSLLEGVYEDPEGKAALQSAVVKSAHDKLNHDGVEVGNKFATWKLSGDKTLAASGDTQEQIRQALEAGRAQLDVVATTMVAAPDEALIANVLDHFPEPTAPAQKVIDDLLAEVTDPKGKMAGAIAGVASAEIEALLDAIERKGKVRRKPS